MRNTRGGDSPEVSITDSSASTRQAIMIGKTAMSIDKTAMSELEEKLRHARLRLTDAVKALAPKHTGAEEEEYRAAQQELYEAERALAAANGEEYAVPIEMPSWNAGAPLPHLLQADNHTFLIYILRDHEGYRDLTIEDVERAGGAPEWFAVIEFDGCESSKMGTPNDEVFSGHPLYGKGFVPYIAMAVKNSTWIRQLEKINSVHRQYRSDKWRQLQHYILPFHDCTFECVARGFKAERLFKGLPQLLWELSGGPPR